MRKKQIFQGAKFLCLLLLIGGCSTLHKKSAVKEGISLKEEMIVSGQVPSEALKKPIRITQDVFTFYDLQKADLNDDGIEEIIALYKTPLGSSGVKVISLSESSEGKILFSKYFDSPDVQYKVRGGIPTIIVRGEGDVAGCGVSKSYCWDGKAFTLDKSSCKLSIVAEP